MAELADAAAQKAIDDKCAELRVVLAELGYEDDEVMLKTETFRHFLCVKMSICERMRHESRSCSARGSQPTPELPLQETPPASDCSEGGEAVVDGPRAPASGEGEAAARDVAANVETNSSVLRTTDGCIGATGSGAASADDDRRSGIGDASGATRDISESHITGRGLNDAERVSPGIKDAIRPPTHGTEKVQIAAPSDDARKQRSIETSNVKSVTQERCRKRKKSRRKGRRAKRAATTSSRSDSSDRRSRTSSPHRHNRRSSRHRSRRRPRRHGSRHRRRHSSRSRSRSRSPSGRRSPSPRSRVARCSSSRSPSIRRRTGSPTHWDRRRITSARKRPVPYVRVPTPPSSTDSSPARYGRTGRLRRSSSVTRRTRSSS